MSEYATKGAMLVCTINSEWVVDNSIYFKKFTHYGDFCIDKLGKTHIYKGSTDDGSNAGRGSYYFLLSEEGKKGIIFVDDSIFFIKKRTDDLCYYIGCISNMHNGLVEIYDFINDEYQKVLSSLDDSEYEFSTYTQKRTLNSINNGLEYTIWSENGGLKFENIDVNKDSFLDIKFSGIIKGYFDNCPENIYEKYVEMIFVYNPDSTDTEWKRYVPNKNYALPFDIEKLYKTQNREELRK